MMKEAQPERQYHFLDRNYMEEFKDPETMRQVLSNLILTLRPDVSMKYHEMEDALLVALFFKNPPGRLLRR